MIDKSTVADKLHANSPTFVGLDLHVDEGYDSATFLDLIYSFRHNYTLQHLTVIRKEPTNAGGIHEAQKIQNHRSSGNQNLDTFRQRSNREIRMLLIEILKLPKLQTLNLENFHLEELDKFDDLFRSSACR